MVTDYHVDVFLLKVSNTRSQCLYSWVKLMLNVVLYFIGETCCVMPPREKINKVHMRNKLLCRII